MVYKYGHAYSDDRFATLIRLRVSFRNVKRAFGLSVDDSGWGECTDQVPSLLTLCGTGLVV